MADYLTKSLSCSFLPGDLMIEILCRLPVQSLTRFKRVNKTWYFLIKTQFFNRIHFDHVSKLEDESFIHLKSNSTESELFLIRPGSNKLEPLGIKEPGENEIVGVSKGLICLTKLGNLFGCYFTVWNPALAQSKLIYCNTSNSNIHPIEFLSIGFGYDELGDDFKIVKVERLRGASEAGLRLLRVHIYSFRSNSWKNSESFSDFIIGTTLPLATLGSCIYWPAYTTVDNERRLVVFNFSTETFHISCPFPGKCVDIVALKQEYLALLFHGTNNNNIGGVWTMSTQGYDIVKRVDRNWLGTHPLSVENYMCLLRTSCGKVVSSRRDGDFLVIKGHDIVLYSPKENKFTSIDEHSKSRCIMLIWCFRESLFSLN